MCEIVINRHGVMLREVVPLTGMIKTGRFYEKQMLNKLKKQYVKHCSCKGIKNMSLLHDRIPSHKETVLTGWGVDNLWWILPLWLRGRGWSLGHCWSRGPSHRRSWDLANHRWLGNIQQGPGVIMSLLLVLIFVALLNILENQANES